MNRVSFDDKILILGGNGFLGNGLLKGLIKSGFCKLYSGEHHHSQKIKGVNSLKLDLLNFKSLEKDFRQFSLIINCTGQMTEPINNCLRLNTLGISNLCQAVSKSNTKILQISTVAVYGTAQIVDENSPSNPETPYACCKAFAEYMLQKNLNPSNLSILRMSNLYGKSQKKGLMPYLIKSFKEGSTIQINNDGSLFRYFIHINDCTKIIVDFLKQDTPSGIFNLSGEEGYTILDLVNLFKKNFKSTPNIEYSLLKPLENITEIDTGKIKSVIKIKYSHNINSFLSEA